MTVPTDQGTRLRLLAIHGDRRERVECRTRGEAAQSRGSGNPRVNTSESIVWKLQLHFDAGR